MKIIAGSGPVSDAFIESDVKTFGDACEWVKALPYKRNSTKDDPLIVIKEARGTCSTKHEIIKRLAGELEMVGCKLILCIFKMGEENTPDVKSVLNQYGLSYLPEAHTYIELNGEIYDLTFPDDKELLYLKDVLFTEEISAGQILIYKEELHKSFVKRWGEENDVSFTFEELWKIREECIQVLSK